MFGLSHSLLTLFTLFSHYFSSGPWSLTRGQRRATRWPLTTRATTSPSVDRTRVSTWQRSRCGSRSRYIWLFLPSFDRFECLSMNCPSHCPSPNRHINTNKLMSLSVCLPPNLHNRTVCRFVCRSTTSSRRSPTSRRRASSLCALDLTRGHCSLGPQITTFASLVSQEACRNKAVPQGQWRGYGGASTWILEHIEPVFTLLKACDVRLGCSEKGMRQPLVS